ncbi:MAG: DUF2029 domain-containing protein [Chloroflexi bacterium]|uniref:DUF2029 domain-containing protein n=1 Tax=Candidatus Chlorohelix allophototropha TaxID=3003348 RepID=A0A8T7M1E5_9CHLR|nr:DUF2029 domain-containing protein [Chloroflexota bacterium]WJW67685.1 DUF2029 domain-containing protein [Chloroflexota bacterium L227-S17]
MLSVNTRFSESFKKRFSFALLGLTLFLCLFFLFQILLILIQKKAIFAIDFKVYWASGKAIHDNFSPYGANLLQFSEAQFLYPPLFAILMVPFSLLPFEIAGIIWLILSLCLLGAICVFIIKLVGYPKTIFTNTKTVTLILLGISTLLYPVFSAIKLGQISTLIFFLIVAALLAQYRNKPILGGLLLGLAISLKITPLPLLIFAFWVGWYHLGITASLTFFGTQIVSAIYNPSIFFEYWFSVFPKIASITGGVSLSLQGLVTQLAPSQLLFLLVPVTIIISAIIILIPFSLVFSKHDPQIVLQGFVLLLCGLGIGLPTVEDHYLIWLILPNWMILNYLIQKNALGKIVLFLLTIILLAWKPYELGGIITGISGTAQEQAINNRLVIGRVILEIVSFWFYIIFIRNLVVPPTNVKTVP